MERGRKLPFEGGVKCNSEDDQTGLKQQGREMRTQSADDKRVVRRIDDISGWLS